MTNAPMSASLARWTPQSATWRNSSLRWSVATALTAARAEVVKPSLHIGQAHQFPNFAPYLPKAEQRPDLAAGLGVIVFEGPQGRGFFKGGHDGQTANSFVCLKRGRRCVLLLAIGVQWRGPSADRCGKWPARRPLRSSATPASRRSKCRRRPAASAR